MRRRIRSLWMWPVHVGSAGFILIAASTFEDDCNRQSDIDPSEVICDLTAPSERKVWSGYTFAILPPTRHDATSSLYPFALSTLLFAAVNSCCHPIGRNDGLNQTRPPRHPNKSHAHDIENSSNLRAFKRDSRLRGSSDQIDWYRGVERRATSDQQYMACMMMIIDNEVLVARAPE